MSATPDPFIPRNPADNDFFYGGANRGATLDALIYVLTHGEGREGIITVIGERGSGKTTLCRMLMKRLPGQTQTVYLAQSVSTPEEFLNLIIHQLKPVVAGLIEKEDVTNSIGGSYGFKSAPAIVSELHSLLDQKHRAGRRVVLLIDEAQELSAEVLDELRALYELESSRHKLLQIVLFGQHELVRAWLHMHKLKSCIAHRFDLKPLGRKAVNEYLVLRPRAGGDDRSSMLTPEAARLIGLVSGGLIQHLNILADRSLQIALSGSAGNTADINVDHVNVALKETGLRRDTTWRNWLEWSSFGHRTAGVSATLIVAVLGMLGWLAVRAPSPEVSSVVTSAAPEVSPPAQASLITPVPVPVPVPVPAPATTYPPNVMIAANVPSPASSAASAPGSSSGAATGTTAGATGAPTGMKASQDNRTAAAAEPIPGSTAGGLETASKTASTYRAGKLHIAGVKLEGYKLLEQRIEATMKLMGGVDKNQYTIQLFWTDNVQPDRMERFLIRAENLIDLSNLYVHPENNGDKAKFRVTYGIYPNRDQATAAIAELPEKYKESFHPELVALTDLR